jgi:hypothetical protein
MWKLRLGWVGHLDLIYVLVKAEIVGPQGINLFNVAYLLVKSANIMRREMVAASQDMMRTR